MLQNPIWYIEIHKHQGSKTLWNIFFYSRPKPWAVFSFIILLTIMGQGLEILSCMHMNMLELLGLMFGIYEPKAITFNSGSGVRVNPLKYLTSFMLNTVCDAPIIKKQIHFCRLRL